MGFRPSQKISNEKGGLGEPYDISGLITGRLKFDKVTVNIRVFQQFICSNALP